MPLQVWAFEKVCARKNRPSSFPAPLFLVKSMRQPAKEIRYFLFSQPLADGMRITGAVLLPGFLFYQFHTLIAGFAVSLGALAVSLTDAPGPVITRRNSMLITAGFAFLVALVTGFMRLNVFLLGAEIAVVTFFFSLLQVFGARGAGVGNAAILILVLTMGKAENQHPVTEALFILTGGIWYTLISLFFYYLRPYRPAERVLGDCLRELADYLSIKGLFYDAATDLHENYKKLVAKQIVVSDKQDAVREILFKTARIANEHTYTGRRLVAAFVHSVDLFEDITATYYNYSTLRARFEGQSILPHMVTAINRLAAELDKTGIAIQAGQRHLHPLDLDAQVIELKKEVDAVNDNLPHENTLVLKKILVNLRRIAGRMRDIQLDFDPEKKPQRSRVDHSQFISHQPISLPLFRSNLNFGSTAFRHALRVALACLAGFVISKLLAYGQHSYWILLTIAFILKPTFSLTKTRNVDRILGTVAGAVLGVLVLYFIHNTTVHFIFLALFMLGAYTFLRTRYIIMVICSTAYILILFQFLNIPFITVVQERVFDTLLGCAIAFSAGYFLFPDWESAQIKHRMADVLRAEIAYLQTLTERLDGSLINSMQYKLARKAVYVQSANFSGAYQRMLAEPRTTQYNRQALQQFSVRTHLLLSNIAHLATLLKERGAEPSPGILQAAQRSVHKLHEVLKMLDPATTLPPMAQNETPAPADADDVLVKQSLDYIAALSDNLRATTEAVFAA